MDRKQIIKPPYDPMIIPRVKQVSSGIRDIFNFYPK